MKDSQDPVNPETDLAVAVIDELTPPARAERNFSGINIGGNTVTQSTAHLPEEVRVIVRAVYHDSRERNLTWPQIAEETGKSSNFWYCVWTDRYRYPLTVTERHCNHCKKNVETKSGGACKACGSRDVAISNKPHPKAGLPIPFGRDTLEGLRKWKARADKQVKVEGDFCQTSVVERVDALCGRAFKLKKIALVYGESHVGKTWALQDYARRHNSGETTYARIPPSAGVQMMTRTIAKALKVGTGTNYESLLEDVKEALDPSKLLIIDEIHRILTTYQKTSVLRCLETLREIYDATGCGMVICGTPQFRDTIYESAFSQFLKQLHRRAPLELYLEDEPMPADLALIARHYGLPAQYESHNPKRGEKDKSRWVTPAPDYTVRVGDEEVAVLPIIKHLTHAHGLGVFCTRLQDALELAAKKEERADWGHFVKAHNIAQKLARQPEAKPWGV